jgi:uncharacterized repeat protein (TIGR01451 family)
MRWIYLAILILLVTGVHAKDSDDSDEVTFRDFALNVGDYIDIGNYRAELIEIQSVADGIVVMRVFEPAGSLDEQRALLQNSANNFDGGAENGGVTLTLIDILDDDSARVRLEYKEGLGTPRKRSYERPRTSADVPNVAIDKTFDRTSVPVGGDVRVTISIKNLGSGAASQVSVQDLPPLSEFSYIAGYPPKMKSDLEPGESDSAVYVMTAVKEGPVSVPAIEVKYQDSKQNTKSNSSSPFSVTIEPKPRPNLQLYLDPSGAISEGGEGSLNVTLSNTGQASATRIEVQGSIKPSVGLEAVGLEKSFFEVAPGEVQSYTAILKGDRPGNYTISLRASFLDGGSSLSSERTTDVSVKEREYKYLYYLLIVPVLVIAVLMFRRYREYKY